jgi:NADP-dependent 3-hydroxy acid dehydrogenase YdfG
MPEGPGTVLVTGGASGLGAAVAAAVREAGGEPVVLDVAPAADVRIDLADPQAARAAVQAAIVERGGLDALVCAAGVDRPAPFDRVDWADWERVVTVNLLGTAAVVHAALPALAERGGRVVTVASTLGFRVFPDASAYCASKFGVVGFTRALALEWQGRVGFTLLVPGGMRTHFFDGRDEQYKPAAGAQLNDPADVAAAVLFALRQPPGCEVRELVVTPASEPSWP